MKTFLKIGLPILFFGLLIPAMGFSQQRSVVSGYIPGGESADIRLMTFRDYISYEPVIAASSKTDSLGNFQLTVQNDRIREYFLEIGHYTLVLYIDTSGLYTFVCDSIFLKDQLRPYYNKESLPCRIEEEPEPGLNRLISRLNNRFNGFIEKEFGGIYNRRNTNVLDALKDQLREEFPPGIHPFFDPFIDYKVGLVELAMAPTKKPELFRELLDNRPVLYHHPEYMRFFNDFFDRYLFPDNPSIPRTDLYYTINNRENLPALLDSLGKDTILRNEVIRELVCLKSLQSLYFLPEFSKKGILKLLQTFETGSKFEDHRNIATNLVEGLTRFEKGEKPPEIVLPDLEGNQHNLMEYNGNPTYICFFTTWSYGCLTELELMRDLYERYQGKISFIGISLDNNIDIVRQLTAEKNYSWEILYNGTDYPLILNYRIKTFPVFLLLDAEGSVVEYPAYKPSEIIHEQFDRLLKKR